MKFELGKLFKNDKGIKPQDHTGTDVKFEDLGTENKSAEQIEKELDEAIKNQTN